LSIIDDLNIKAESNPLSTYEKEALRDANERLNKLRRDEETKWAQWAKVKHHVQEGGNNTKYFHLIANGKHREKNISIRTRRSNYCGGRQFKGLLLNTLKKTLW
jgi:hypothetical protein